MNLLAWVFAGAGVTAAAVAVQAGNNLDVALPAGAAAILLVAIVGVTQFQSAVAPIPPARAGMLRQVPRQRVESDSMLRLRRAFQTGEIGRSSILATIRALERDLSPGGRTLLSLETERRILELPPEQFRHWIDDRLRRIESAT